MSYRQSGYSPAGKVAKKSDKQITSLQDIRARKTRAVTGQNATTHAGSAAGIPGYYSSQRGPAVTKKIYRQLAALGNIAGAFDAGGTQEDDRKERFYRAQDVVVVDGSGAYDLDAAARQAPIHWDDRFQLQGFGVKLERDDVEFLEQKRAEELQFKFDEWLTRRINLDDPANQRWVQEIYPEFYDRRERFIDDKINLEAALAKIKLRGVKGKEDLQLLYAVNAGLVQPSSRPLFAAAGPTAGTDYQEGMISVLQWFTGSGSGTPSEAAAVGNAQTRLTGAFARPHTIIGKAGTTLGL